jgi:hypothetical protein
MAAVAAYLIATVATLAVLFVATSRGQPVARNPAFRPEDVSSRYVTIAGGLAGFAVTTLVLIVTLGRTVANTSSISYTSLLTLILVAYFGFFSTSILYAGVSESDRTDAFDVPAAMLVGASVTLTFSVFTGWLALVPLLETFGLNDVAAIAKTLIVAALIGAAWSLGMELYRSGFFTLKQIVLIPLLALGATVVWAAVVNVVSLREPNSVLALTVLAAVVGTLGLSSLRFMPVLARHPSSAQLVIRYGRQALIMFTLGAMLYIGFLTVTVFHIT